jgi:hypothetical protein
MPPAPPFHHADRDLAEDALRELIAEIAMGDYRDRNGLRLTMNTAFLKARTLLEVSEALERGVTPGN